MGSMKIISVRIVTLAALAWLGESQVCQIRHSQKYSGLLADCSDRGLSMVPTGIPTEIVAFDLSMNRIEVLNNFTFSNFSELIDLNLSRNILEKLEPESFTGLSRLKTLHLGGNSLSANNISFPYELFKDLKSLQTLHLNNTEIESYPDWVFRPLMKLRHLSIDSIPRPLFKSGFSNLVNLEFLQIGGKGLISDRTCSVQEIQNNTFESFRKIELKTLIIKSCHMLMSINSAAFEPLMYLTTLVLSGNNIGVPKSLEILKPFTGRNMTKIDLSSVFPISTYTFSTAFNSFLTKNNTKYLTQICLKEFVFRKNHIVLIEEKALFGNPLMSCIERLDLSNNNLLGSVKFLFELSMFSNLKYLNIQRQSLNGITIRKPLETVSVFGNVIITLPPLLEYLDFTGLLTDHTKTNVLTFKNSNKLKVVLFGSSFISFQVVFLDHNNIEQLDLSGNNIGLMNSTFFRSFNKVKRLSLHDCNLRFGREMQVSFQYFTDLLYLDISRNFLTSLPPLPKSLELKQLNLSENSLDDIPFHIVNTDLHDLDMSFNSISHLSRDSQNILDQTFVKNNLSVRFYGNPFSCRCNNLNFVLWLVESPAVYETSRNFQCTMDDGTITDALNVAQNIIRYTRLCNGRFSLNLTVILGTVLIMFLSGTYIISKNPTRYRNKLQRIFGLGTHEYTSDEFDFRLYVGYCEGDIPFVYRILKPALERERISLFLKDIEVLPGRDIADGIIEGVNISWKTLLLVSQDFLMDPWSYFTINTAVYSMTDQIPDRITVLLMDDVDIKDLPQSLLNAVDEELVLSLRDFEQDGRFQWRRFANVANI